MASLAARARAAGLPPWTVRNRVRRGWTVEAALAAPVLDRAEVCQRARDALAVKRGDDPAESRAAAVKPQRQHAVRWPKAPKARPLTDDEKRERDAAAHRRAEDYAEAAHRSAKERSDGPAKAPEGDPPW